jgi:large subunit ribosomal protein L19
VYQDVFIFCRYVYPDFLPSTNWKHRDRIREILERKDMYRRRLVMEIPEFYVGMFLP